MRLLVVAAGQRPERELEERVERDAAGVDGGHARRCGHDHLLGQAFLQRAQEGGFARARLAGQEQVPAGVLHVVEGQIQRGIG